MANGDTAGGAAAGGRDAAGFLATLGLESSDGPSGWSVAVAAAPAAGVGGLGELRGAGAGADAP